MGNKKSSLFILSVVIASAIIVTLFYGEITFAKTANKKSILITKEVLQEESEHIFDEKQGEISKKFAYLTFDDGPSYIVTNKILDVLEQQNVKATFFVVGKEIKGRTEILRRMYREGHSIGLHTYSHNFKYIYKSQDSFIHEMKKTSFMINEILGITPTAIRFPGGSDRGLNEEFLEKLHQNNFKVFDWNVNIGDGINARLSTERLISNSKKVKGDPTKAIILAHFNSNNHNTYKALPGIIKFYREQGYNFKPIKESTPEYYYKFKKKNKDMD